MTTTTRLAGGGNGLAPGLDGQRRTRSSGAPRRRSWARVGAGLAVAVACGSIGALLYGAAGARRPVLAVARAVHAGDTISAADLTTVRIPANPGLAPVPAQDAAAVVGRQAAVALVPGTLLTSADLSSGPVLGPGSASVGLDLKAGHSPGGLVPGAAVMVVVVPAAAGPGGPTQGPSVLVDSAKVLSVVPPSASSGNGDTEVTLAVPAALAAEVAGAGAQGEVALVGLGPGGSS